MPLLVMVRALLLLGALLQSCTALNFFKGGTGTASKSSRATVSAMASHLGDAMPVGRPLLFVTPMQSPDIDYSVGRVCRPLHGTAAAAVGVACAFRLCL